MRLAERQQRVEYAEKGVEGASAEFIARFWSKVKKTSKCWVWLPPPAVRGYGQIGFNGRPHASHRVAFELTFGPIPKDLCVCHHCDNRICVNPQHLFLGTPADNLNDARQKARLIDGLGARKLSDDAYREILAAKGYGVGRQLAKKFGVTHIQISRIRNGRSGVTYQRSLSDARAEKAS